MSILPDRVPLSTGLPDWSLKVRLMEIVVPVVKFFLRVRVLLSKTLLVKELMREMGGGAIPDWAEAMETRCPKVVVNITASNAVRYMDGIPTLPDA
jgi:hypothetical protein